MTQKKRDRCLQEVALLQQLSHPFIIQMYDAFIDENMLIIIFEWAPAGDLKRLIKKTAEAGKTLDEATIWSSFFQITDALRFMHQHRIMHRDIKPAASWECNSTHSACVCALIRGVELSMRPLHPTL